MTALERPGVAKEGVRSEARPLQQIFPLAENASRDLQMQETWLAFCREMVGAVKDVLDGRRSPPEIAYAVGEIVHNYFRTRGLTLTSYELRRLVAELLASHAPQDAPPPAFESVVSFAKPEPTRPPSGWTGDDVRPPVPEPPAKLAVTAPPSALVRRIEPHDAAFDRVLTEVLERARSRTAGLPRQAALEAIAVEVDHVLRDEAHDWPVESRERLGLVALSELFGLGLIDRLWADRSIQAIFVNGPKSVYVERDGRLEPADELFRDEAHLQELLGRLVRKAEAPVADIQLRDGGTGIVVFPPAAPAGPVLALRRGDPGEATFERLIASELLDRRTADLLRIAARARLNIVVQGPRGSGKTAVLAALARDLAALRVVTVAAHRAFRWPSPTKIELAGEPPALRPLIEAALRLRPDLLILDSVSAGDVPAGQRGIIAALDAGPRPAADLLVQLGRAPDGLFRVLALRDAAGVEIFPQRAASPAFADAIAAAGYGDALARLLS